MTRRPLLTATMGFLALALFVIPLSGCATAAAARDPGPPASAPAAVDPVQARAEEVAALIAPDKEPVPGLFTEQMSNYRGQILERLREVYASYGRAIAVTKQDSTDTTGVRFDVLLERDGRFVLTVVIEPTEPHRIAGLWMTPPEAASVTPESIVARFRTLPGKSSLLITRLDRPGTAPLAAWNETAPLAIGSTFKLSILAALDDEIRAGKRRWSDILTLEERFRSQPSGVLHKWPLGTPLTLQALATLMISISDNTATDHLLFALGRDRVEATLGGVPKATLPFLSTAEAFRLKSHGAVAARWGGMTSAERRALLANEVASLPFGDFGPSPSYPDTVEWFYSASDLCRTIGELGKRGPEVRGILAVNTPFVEPGAFTWSGYKGGSESGVKNMTYLLEKKDATYCVSATWNDLRELDDTRFSGLVREALRLVAAN